MQLHMCKPSPVLRTWIDRYWICENYHPLHELEFKLHDVHTSWIFNLRDDHFRIYGHGTPDRYEHMPGAIVVGPKTSRFHYEKRYGIRIQQASAANFPSYLHRWNDFGAWSNF